MIYFDSCYLAKLYLMEPDSPAVRAKARASGDVVCCLIGWGELVATLHRHLRDGRLTVPQFRLLSAQVATDVQEGLWTPLPITSELAEAHARRMSGLSAVAHPTGNGSPDPRTRFESRPWALRKNRC